MAARRSSRSRSDRGTRNRRSSAAAAQTNNPAVVAIGVGAVVLVIVIAVVTMGGDGKKPEKPTTPASKEAPRTGSEGAPDVSESSYSAKSKSLRTPDTPAPEIVAEVLRRADEAYAKAKKQHDDARRVQKIDNAQFSKLINDSWDTFGEIDILLDEYTTWLEDADMGDWRVPLEYVQLQRRLAKYDKLRGRIRRIKPTRR